MIYLGLLGIGLIMLGVLIFIVICAVDSWDDEDWIN